MLHTYTEQGETTPQKSWFSNGFIMRDSHKRETKLGLNISEEIHRDNCVWQKETRTYSQKIRNAIDLKSQKEFN